MTQPAAISSGVRLSHLLAGFAEVNTALDPEITSLTLDSRKVSNGGLFWPVREVGIMGWSFSLRRWSKVPQRCYGSPTVTGRSIHLLV